MSKTENKVVALSTTFAMTFSVLAILIGAGIGWGIIQTRVTSLEARAETITRSITVCESKKIDKEVYYKDIGRLHTDLREIKSDIKTLLQAR